jgi:hypothetical protein
MTYRTATPQEIAACIRGQVVDTCDLAEAPEYKSKPTKLLGLIRGIKIYAKSNADWLDSQRAPGNAKAKHTVWILWGATAELRKRELVEEHIFDTLAELNAFMLGVDTAMGYEDFTQFDSPSEVEEYFAQLV